MVKREGTSKILALSFCLPYDSQTDMTDIFSNAHNKIHQAGITSGEGGSPKSHFKFFEAKKGHSMLVS